MKLCLKCYSLWPRDAAFCGKCRRPLGSKRCPKGHANPLFSPATTCLVCNEGPLDGMPCLPLGWVAPLLTLLLLIGLWRWGWDHPCLVITTLWKVCLWTLGVLFDTTPGRVNFALRQALVWYIVLWLLSYLLPQGAGRPVRQILKELPRLAWRGLRALLRLIKPLVLRTVGLGKAKAKPAQPKEAAHETE